MNRAPAVLVVLSALLSTTVIPARAEFGGANGATVVVGPTTAGPVISQGTAGYDPSGTQATAESHGTTSASPPPFQGTDNGYTYREIPYNAVVVPGPLQMNQYGVIQVQQGAGQAACPSGQTGYYSYDPNGNFAGVVCVGNQAPPPANATAAQLAEMASQRQPWPNLAMGVNPGQGLTGLSSWFWLGGGTPSMPDATASASGMTVTVRATLVDVIWDFGDGSGYDSGWDVGQAYPASSDVQHVYQTDTFGRPAGYLISALLRFKVTYSVNGGPWTVLGIKARPYSRPYSVSQLQPQAVSNP
jgi:hypothetical protein